MGSIRYTEDMRYKAGTACGALGMSGGARCSVALTTLRDMVDAKLVVKVGSRYAWRRGVTEAQIVAYLKAHDVIAYRRFGYIESDKEIIIKAA